MFRNVYKYSLASLIAMLYVGLIPTYEIVHADETDQYCEDTQITNGDNAELMVGHTLKQTFIPTTTTLTEVGLVIAMGGQAPGTVTAEIRQVTGGDTLLATGSTTATNVPIGWVSIAFDNISLDTTKTYSITASTNKDTPMWYYSTDDCYARGNAIYDGENRSYDYGFYTQGHGSPPTAIPNSTDPTTTDTSNVETTGNSVSTSIDRPTALTGTYDANARTAKLSWTKSTTADIAGYYIYRSTEEKKSYQKIAQVAKSITTYDDVTSLSNGTYFYVIRAYTDTSVSLASNTASITIQNYTSAEDTLNTTAANTLSTQPTENVSFFDKILKSITFYVISGVAALVLITILFLSIVARKRNISIQVLIRNLLHLKN